MVSPPFGSPVGEPHLNPRLAQPCLLAQLLPDLEVGVVRVPELLLQVLELGRLESAPASPELGALVVPLLTSVRLVRVHVRPSRTVGTVVETRGHLSLC